MSQFRRLFGAHRKAVAREADQMVVYEVSAASFFGDEVGHVLVAVDSGTNTQHLLCLFVFFSFDVKEAKNIGQITV